MKNKKAIIILSAILVIVATVCCILFIPSNKNKDIANEKENIYKDITPKDYGYDIPDSTEIEIDGTKVKLEDLTFSFKDFPSTLISKANEITYKDKLYMIENSPSDFDHNIIDEEFAKKNEFESVEDAYEVKDFEIDLSSYKTNDSINEPFPTDRKKFYTLKTIDGNQVYITFASSDFKTYKDYIQACYDVFYEIVSKYKSEELKSKIAFIESYKMTDVLFKSIDDGNYNILFDAVMNHAVAIVSLDGNIHTRIEFSTMQIDDNTIIDVLEIRKSYLFDTNNVM